MGSPAPLCAVYVALARTPPSPHTQDSIPSLPAWLGVWGALLPLGVLLVLTLLFPVGSHSRKKRLARGFDSAFSCWVPLEEKAVSQGMRDAKGFF